MDKKVIKRINILTFICYATFIISFFMMLGIVGNIELDKTTMFSTSNIIYCLILMGVVLFCNYLISILYDIKEEYIERHL